VYESDGDLDALQQLIDSSFARASEHLRSIMTPQRRLSALELVAALPAPAVLNVATVTARGEPRISAVDGHFLSGAWHFGTAKASPKAVQMRARPATSAAYTPRDGFGVFCHGRAVRLTGAALERLDEHWQRVYGAPLNSLGDVSCFRIEATWLVAFEFARDDKPDGETNDLSAAEGR
jgi:hypothetical protein